MLPSGSGHFGTFLRYKNALRNINDVLNKTLKKFVGITVKVGIDTFYSQFIRQVVAEWEAE